MRVWWNAESALPLPVGSASFYLKRASTKKPPHILRRITFHDLRHTYASLLLKRGEPIKYVSEQLGHADVETTMKLYWHLVPNVHPGA